MGGINSGRTKGSIDKTKRSRKKTGKNKEKMTISIDKILKSEVMERYKGKATKMIENYFLSELKK